MAKSSPAASFCFSSKLERGSLNPHSSLPLHLQSASSHPSGDRSSPTELCSNVNSGVRIWKTDPFLGQWLAPSPRPAAALAHRLRAESRVGKHEGTITLVASPPAAPPKHCPETTHPVPYHLFARCPPLRAVGQHAPMSRQWIADRLHRGSPAYVTKLTASAEPAKSVDYQTHFLTPFPRAWRVEGVFHSLWMSNPPAWLVLRKIPSTAFNWEKITPKTDDFFAVSG